MACTRHTLDSAATHLALPSTPLLLLPSGALLLFPWTPLALGAWSVRLLFGVENDVQGFLLLLLLQLSPPDRIWQPPGHSAKSADLEVPLRLSLCLSQGACRGCAKAVVGGHTLLGNFVPGDPNGIQIWRLHW